MRRLVLAIPLEEVEQHLLSNDRQDVKIVVPERLGEDLYERLVAEGRSAKQEEPLEETTWKHSERSKPNLVCESSDFVESDGEAAHRSFALSFANEKASQDRHFHKEHAEIYYSEHPMSAEYRCPGEASFEEIVLAHGGALVFGPGVVHQVKLEGLTFVFEIPSVKNDKVRA